MNYIYYFSGTGNGLQITNDLASQMKEVKICKISEYKEALIDGDSLGIIFPVYMFGLPLIVAKFLEQLKVSETTYVYAIANLGGIPGKALDQCEAILAKNEIKLSAGFLIQMPGNNIILYGAVSESKQERLFLEESIRIPDIVKQIKEKRSTKIEKSHAIFDRLFSKAVYKRINRFHEDDRNFTVSKECTSCGLCVSRCPVNNIKLVEGLPTWQHHCEKCLACIQICPVRAIDYKKKANKRKRYYNPNL